MDQPNDETALYNCSACGGRTSPDTVSITMWTNRGWAIVEDIDARICVDCHEQFYSEESKGKLLQLSGNGFPDHRVIREITVPVYSLDETKKDQEKRS